MICHGHPEDESHVFPSDVAILLFTSEPCNPVPFWLPGSSRVELPAKTAGQGIGEFGDCDILGAICSMLGLFI